MSEIPDEEVEADTAVDAVDVEPAEDESLAAEPSSAEVARASAELAGLDDLDLADHPDAYQRIHAELQNALASIDDA